MEELAEQLFELYIYLPRQFKKLFYTAAGQDSALGLTELKILNELEKIGPCKMSELADALVVTMGGLTPHMDKLVEKGFVIRFRDEERDRRLVLVEITEDGKNVLHDTKDLFLNTLRQYLKNFSEEQQGKIQQAVNTLRETLNL